MNKFLLIVSIFLSVILLSGCVSSCVNNQTSSSSSLPDSSSSSSENTYSSSSLDESSDTQGSVAPKTQKSISLAGTSFVISGGIDRNGNKISAQQVKSFTKELSLTFIDDTNCKISALSSSVAAIYSFNGKNISINNGEFSGVYSKNTITIDYNGLKIILKKS